jgi:hypothetical protein
LNEGRSTPDAALGLPRTGSTQLRPWRKQGVFDQSPACATASDTSMGHAIVNVADNRLAGGFSFISFSLKFSHHFHLDYFLSIFMP